MLNRIPPAVVSVYLSLLFFGVLYFLVTFNSVSPRYQFALFIFLVELITVLFIHLVELQRKKPWGPEPQYEQALLLGGVSFCPFLLAALNTISPDRVGLMMVFDAVGINFYLTGVSTLLMILMFVALGVIFCSARKQGRPVLLFSIGLILYVIMIAMKSVQGAGGGLPDSFFFMHLAIPTLFAAVLWASIPRLTLYNSRQELMAVLLCALILISVMVYLKFYAGIDLVYYFLQAAQGSGSIINSQSMTLFMIALVAIAGIGIVYLFFEALFTGKLLSMPKPGKIQWKPQHKVLLALVIVGLFAVGFTQLGFLKSDEPWAQASDSGDEFYAVQIGIFKHNYNVDMGQLCYKNTEIFRMVPSKSQCDILQSYLVSDIRELYRLIDITKESCPGVQSPVILLYNQYKTRTHVWDDQKGDWVYSPEENLRSLRGC